MEVAAGAAPAVTAPAARTAEMRTSERMFVESAPKGGGAHPRKGEARCGRRIGPVAPGDVQLAFAQAAAEDGIVLGSRSFDWLCEQGHVGARARRQGPARSGARGARDGGLRAARRDLRAPRRRRLRPARGAREPAAPGGARPRADRHGDRGRRVAALHHVPPVHAELYSAGTALGFDPDEYADLCRTWCSSTDGLARGLPAKGFGFGGVQRERAYRDALLDLAAPAMGLPPVVRIAAVDGDGAAAYRRNRAALLASV